MSRLSSIPWFPLMSRWHLQECLRRSRPNQTELPHGETVANMEFSNSCCEIQNSWNNRSLWQLGMLHALQQKELVSTKDSCPGLLLTTVSDPSSLYMSFNKIGQLVELSFNTVRLWSFNLISFWGASMWGVLRNDGDARL